MMEKKLGFISYNKSGWLSLKFETANTLFNTLYGGKDSGLHKFESLMIKKLGPNKVVLI